MVVTLVAGSFAEAVPPTVPAKPAVAAKPVAKPVVPPVVPPAKPGDDKKAVAGKGAPAKMPLLRIPRIRSLDSKALRALVDASRAKEKAKAKPAPHKPPYLRPPSGQFTLRDAQRIAALTLEQVPVGHIARAAFLLSVEAPGTEGALLAKAMQRKGTRRGKVVPIGAELRTIYQGMVGRYTVHCKAKARPVRSGDSWPPLYRCPGAKTYAALKSRSRKRSATKTPALTSVERARVLLGAPAKPVPKKPGASPRKGSGK